MKAKNFAANFGDLVAFVIDDLHNLSFKSEKHQLPRLQQHDSPLIMKEEKIFESVKLLGNIAAMEVGQPGSFDTKNRCYLMDQGKDKLLSAV